MDRFGLFLFISFITIRIFIFAQLPLFASICYCPTHTEVLFHLASTVDANPRAEPVAGIIPFFKDSVVPQRALSRKTLFSVHIIWEV
jgi:hypothetical protein